LREICVPEDKDQLFSFIRDLGKLLGQDDENIKNILKQIEMQDRSTCQLRPMSLFKE